MRLKEFLTEQQMSDVHDLLDVAKLSLPHSYKMNNLLNSDFYKLYRFGIAIADVRGEEAEERPENKNLDPYKPKFRAQSLWGENAFVSGVDPNLKKVISKAASKVKKSGITTVSTHGSEEMLDTYKTSPVKAFKGYSK